MTATLAVHAILLAMLGIFALYPQLLPSAIVLRMAQYSYIGGNNGTFESIAYSRLRTGRLSPTEEALLLCRYIEDCLPSRALFYNDIAAIPPLDFLVPANPSRDVVRFLDQSGDSGSIISTFLYDTEYGSTGLFAHIHTSGTSPAGRVIPLHSLRSRNVSILDFSSEEFGQATATPSFSSQATVQSIISQPTEIDRSIRSGYIKSLSVAAFGSPTHLYAVINLDSTILPRSEQVILYYQIFNSDGDSIAGGVGVAPGSIETPFTMMRWPRILVSLPIKSISDEAGSNLTVSCYVLMQQGELLFPIGYDQATIDLELSN